ncbi:14730_t:CDS:2, partial [Gigaspora margarita]
MEEYNTAKKDYQTLNDYMSQYISFLTIIKAIEQYGFTIDVSSLTSQIQCTINMNINLMKAKKEIIDKYEREIQEFSLCLLVSSDKRSNLKQITEAIQNKFRRRSTKRRKIVEKIENSTVNSPDLTADDAEE